MNGIVTCAAMVGARIAGLALGWNECFAMLPAWKTFEMWWHIQEPLKIFFSRSERR